MALCILKCFPVVKETFCVAVSPVTCHLEAVMWNKTACTGATICSLIATIQQNMWGREHWLLNGFKCCKDSSKGKLDNNVNAVTYGSTDRSLSVTVVLEFCFSKREKVLHSSSGLFYIGHGLASILCRNKILTDSRNSKIGTVLTLM